MTYVNRWIAFEVELEELLAKHGIEVATRDMPGSLLWTVYDEDSGAPTNLRHGIFREKQG